MAWTEITRKHYERDCPRYASDMTAGEWALIAPFMPLPNRIGRPRKTGLLEVANALLYIASTGCQWRFLPKEFPPFSTVQKYFYRWRDERLLEKINHHLVFAAREAGGREAQPTAGVIDSQSVKTAEARDKFPWLRHVFADGGYAGQKLRRALTKIGDWTIEVIKRPDDVSGFEVLPRRWVVERTFAWLGRSRRLAKDWERSLESAIAWLFIAHIRIVTRKSARPCC